jgi:flagellar hook-length control protein FliK
MAQAIANIVPTSTMATAATAVETSVDGEEVVSEQVFTEVLAAQFASPEGEGDGPGFAAPLIVADSDLPHDFAGSGKDLPPDIAALIAASQPVPPAAAAVVQAAAPALQGDPAVNLAELTDIRRAQLPRLPVNTLQARTDVTDDLVGEALLKADSGAPSGAQTRLVAGTTDAQVPAMPEKLTALTGQGPLPLTERGQTDRSMMPGAILAQELVKQAVDTRGSLSQQAGGQIAQVAPSQGSTGPAGSSAPAPTPVPVPFNQPGWEQVVGNRVMWMVGQQMQSAQLRMDPPHLGPLEVRISVADGQTTVNFTSAHATVRDALHAALPQLRDMFGDSGLNLANVNISQHSFADARQRSGDPGQPGQGGQQDPGSAGNPQHTDNGDESQALITRLGLVDYYA